MNVSQELEERRDHALSDLAELEQQVRDGEIDEQTAAALRVRFQREAAGALRGLRETDVVDASARGPSGRLLVGASVLTLAAVVAAFGLVPRFTDLRPDGGFVTGNEAVAGGRDLSQVTNEEMEAVVADNPDVVPMRLRLAHRYFEEEDLARAVDHYQAVLDREPNPEAMSHLGWVLFLDGEVELASQLIDASLAREPDDVEVRWMQANVLLYGLRDAKSAIPILEALLERQDLEQQRNDIMLVLEDARSMGENP